VTPSSGPDPDFWRGRRVFLTGHTGFKGSWAALWLNALGAETYGFALPPETEPSLWTELGGDLLAGETIADLADLDALRGAVKSARPEIVIHLAAQALARRSHAEPIRTIRTNTLGTAHLLEALRGAADLKAALFITTDKVYANDDSGQPFAEGDRLGGDDPYSASKAAAELLIRSFASSFLEPAGVRVATARAGNVIGGGDWSEDRLVPDVWRAAAAGRPLLLRSPSATRPWQHVLEPLAGYFAYLQALVRDDGLPRSLNFGPAAGDSATVAQIADAIGKALGADRPWLLDDREHPPEAKLLALDTSLARRAIGWAPRLSAAETVEWTARWYSAHHRGADARSLCLEQIHEYEAVE
jgi:CDP-glucose 4,6-dehydratase